MSMRNASRRHILIATAMMMLPGLMPPAVAATGPNLGRPVTSAEIADWDLSVFPDGKGLPSGQGSVAEGERIYGDQCLACHGPEGRGASADELAGARHPLTDPAPDKTIGSYWPYATTIFDFIRRSMPLNAPGSLSNDQVYAVTAYLLRLNGILPEGTELNAVTLAKIVMPNRNGFTAVGASR